MTKDNIFSPMESVLWKRGLQLHSQIVKKAMILLNESESYRGILEENVPVSNDELARIELNILSKTSEIINLEDIKKNIFDRLIRLNPNYQLN